MSYEHFKDITIDVYVCDKSDLPPPQKNAYRISIVGAKNIGIRHPLFKQAMQMVINYFNHVRSLSNDIRWGTKRT